MKLSSPQSQQVPLTKQVGGSDEVKVVAELMKSADFSRAKLSLELLGSMCDGQNRDLQNHFREQHGHIKPVNMVGEIALFMQHFFSGTSFKFHHDCLKDLSAEAESYGAGEPRLIHAARNWRYIRKHGLNLLLKINYTKHL